MSDTTMDPFDAARAVVGEAMLRAVVRYDAAGGAWNEQEEAGHRITDYAILLGVFYGRTRDPHARSGWEWETFHAATADVAAAPLGEIPQPLRDGRDECIRAIRGGWRVTTDAG